MAWKKWKRVVDRPSGLPAPAGRQLHGVQKYLKVGPPVVFHSQRFFAPEEDVILMSMRHRVDRMPKQCSRQTVANCYFLRPVRPLRPPLSLSASSKYRRRWPLLLITIMMPTWRCDLQRLSMLRQKLANKNSLTPSTTWTMSKLMIGQQSVSLFKIIRFYAKNVRQPETDASTLSQHDTRCLPGFMDWIRARRGSVRSDVRTEFRFSG